MIRIIQCVFIGVLIFAPLAFGASEWWSLAATEFLAVMAFVLFLVMAWGQKTDLYKVPGAVPLFLFLLFIFFQFIPLPVEIVAIISPEILAIHQQTSQIIEPGSWIPLSLNPRATLGEFLRFASYACFYILTVQLLSGKEFLKRTVSIIIVFATLVAALAILQYSSYFFSPEGVPWNGHKIFWLRAVPKHAMPVGPYVYHNHYAGFMEMIIPLVFALFLVYKPRFHYGSVWENIITMLVQKRINVHILLGFAACVMAASFFMSLSRGGLLSLSLAMLLFVGMALTTRSDKRGGFMLFSAVLLAMIAVSCFGWEPIIERFGTITREYGDFDVGRPVFWKDSLEIIRDFPAVGSGFGTFVDIYPAYRTMPGMLLVDHAHNDYIELLVNGGIIAFLLI